jgi:hypothetical protein
VAVLRSGPAILERFGFKDSTITLLLASTRIEANTSVASGIPGPGGDAQSCRSESSYRDQPGRPDMLSDIPPHILLISTVSR